MIKRNKFRTNTDHNQIIILLQIGQEIAFLKLKAWLK